MSVGFGFSVTPGDPLGVGEEMRRAEDLGYDRFGVWDSPALFREPWTTLASVTRDTSRIRLGTWVTNPLSRHPLITAACAATVDDLAPGRVYIGIGAGGTGVWHLGMSTAKLAELEAYVVAVRGLLETGGAEWQGHALTLPWAGRRRIPIIMGAHASRSLRLAGRIADGVVIGLGVTPDVVESSLERLDAGAREGGRSPTTSRSGSRRSGGRTRSRARPRQTEPGRPRRSPCTSPTPASSTSSCRRSSRRRCSRSARPTT